MGNDITEAGEAILTRGNRTEATLSAARYLRDIEAEIASYKRRASREGIRVHVELKVGDMETQAYNLDIFAAVGFIDRMKWAERMMR